MAGSIKNRKLKDGKIVYDIVVDLPRKPDGSRNQVKKRGFRTKKDAQIFIADTLMKINNGYNFNSEKIVLKDYLNRWLETEITGLAPSTQKRYKEFCTHIINHLGEISISKLTGIQIKDFYKALESPQPYSSFRKGLSRSTISKVHKMLHKALTDAVRDGTIEKTVISNIKYGGVEKAKTDFWDKSTVYAFLGEIKDDILYLPVLLAFETGMRQAEITGLKWEDIDFDNKTLTVKRNLAFDESKGVLSDKKTKTKSSLRTIILFDSTINALKKQKQNQRLNKILIGENYKESNYICTNSLGSPINPHYISKKFAKTVVKLNYKRIRFHDLRHSHATYLLSENINPKIVSRRLGHSTISITLDTYTHVTEEIERAALTNINKNISDCTEIRESC